MKKQFTIILCFSLIIFATSCNNTTELTSKQVSDVQDSVKQMAASIEKNISSKGPVAWLQYFEDSPDFFMISDGQMAFSNYDAATKFINDTLVKMIPKIELHWKNIHVDVLSPSFATLAAVFHEDITDAAGNTKPQDGYFTGTVHQTAQGWKLRNAHWSSLLVH